MKASELVELLIAGIREHGDGDVEYNVELERLEIYCSEEPVIPGIEKS
jgi:hypothetical protein